MWIYTQRIDSKNWMENIHIVLIYSNCDNRIILINSLTHLIPCELFCSSHLHIHIAAWSPCTLVISTPDQSVPDWLPSLRLVSEEYCHCLVITYKYVRLHIFFQMSISVNTFDFCGVQNPQKNSYWHVIICICVGCLSWLNTYIFGPFCIIVYLLLFQSLPFKVFF